MEKLYNVLNKISNVICKILCGLIVLGVVANAGSVFLQVLNRFVIVKISDLSFTWTEEFSRVSMIWLCYLAVPIVFREGMMAQLDLIFERLGKKGKMGLYVLTRILCVVFLVLAIYYGFYIVQTKMMFKSSVMRIPGWAMYSAPIVGCVLMLYEMITEMVGTFAGVLEPFYAGNKRKLTKASDDELELEEGGED